MLSPFFGSESHSVVSHSLQPHGLYSPWNSPGQNTGEGSLSLLQRIFPTQGLNPVLTYCSLFPYQLSQKGSPKILEWVAYPFLCPLHCRWILNLREGGDSPLKVEAVRKKEWNNAICCNVNECRDDHTEWSKSEEKDKYHIISLTCGT